MKPSVLAPRPWATGALAALLLGASGCPYETTSVVKIPALQTTYPVSASPHYVDAQGDVVRDTDYEVADCFEFETTVKSPRHEASEATLRLEPEPIASSSGRAATPSPASPSTRVRTIQARSTPRRDGRSWAGPSPR